MADTEKKKSGKSVKMTEPQLLTLIAAYEKSSLGSQVAAGATISTTVYPTNQAMTTLEIDRFNAINMYYARPLGNEVENRSQVVLPELRDTIEWALPQIMRMFVGGKEVCRFEPENPNDTEQAAMETAVVNHVFMNMNNGFFVLHDFFKDGMLMRNGYVQVGWVVEKHTSVENYTGLTPDELTKLLADMEDEETEILEQREYTIQVPLGVPDPTATPVDSGLPMLQMPCFDIKIRRTVKKGRVHIECLPPEEVLVSPRARASLDGVPFVAHKTETPRSDLVEEEYDRDLIDGLPTGNPKWLEMDALARDQVVDQMSVENPADKSMQTVEVRNVTMRVDYDGDGIAELRQIKVAGDKILENEEIEEGPIASCAPMRMPHRHTGLSYYDLIADLQVIKTTLFRQGLDNLYLANNKRMGVDWKNASIDDLLTSRPGGIIRTNGSPTAVLMPIDVDSNIVSHVLPVMQYCDTMKEGRTGVSGNSSGMDPDELQDVNNGVMRGAMSASALKLELVARLLAEGVKEIFQKVHGVLMRHQDGPMEFEISGKWVQIDPSQWRRRTNVTPTVGLGSGNREELRANVGVLGQAQQQLAQFGLVGPKQAFATFKVVCESLGFSQPNQFAMDPAGPEYAAHMQAQASQPHQPPPQVQAAQIRAQADQAKNQSNEQMTNLKLQGQLATAQAELAQEREKAQAEITHAALSTHSDRQQQQSDRQTQVALALIRAIGSVIAVQEQGRQDNAGEIMRQDFEASRPLESE